MRRNTSSRRRGCIEVKWAALRFVALAMVTASPVLATLSGDFVKVQEILARTRTTKATYALYTWYQLPNLPQKEDWAAEFNLGNMHRVETPLHRIVADCVKGVGTHLSVATGESETGAGWAKAACGINANKPLLSADFIGSHMTKYGKVDRVRVVDKDDIRFYDVTSDGILQYAKTLNNAPGQSLTLDTLASTIVRKPLPPEMFTTDSLKRSYVPAEYRHRFKS